MRLLLFFFFASLLFNATAQAYFPIPAPEPTQLDSFAQAIPRTAALLHGEGSELRVLVYGQSISQQNWWNAVRTFLEKTYPETRIVMENRAIGGFSTDRLKRMVENDVLPFYPDLILLHDYGNEPDYETLIRAIQRRTTAEIAVQTDHVAVGQNEAWHDRHNTTWLPNLCRQYGLALLDVRTAWKTYLRENNLPATALLSDNVHLNEHGNFLMAGLVNQYLTKLPANNLAPARVQRLNLNEFVVYRNRFRVPVTGNRVELHWAPSVQTTHSLRVTLDGKKPSEWPGSYYHTRPATRPDGYFLRNIGQVFTLHLGAPPGGAPQEEDWTLLVTALDSVKQRVEFSLRGSRTGDDGAGRSDQPFTSRSNRIGIAPDGWFFRKTPRDFAAFSWLKPGDSLHWQVRKMGLDVATPAAGAAVTVVQGVPNGPHTLELRGRALDDLREIRVYEPPGKP